MKNPQVIFLIVIVAAALIFGGYLLAPSGSNSSGKATATPAAAPANPALINNADSPRMGKTDAKIQIVIFSDFECPYCKSAHQIIDNLLNKYPNDVSVVQRNFIVHPTSEVLADAAEAANLQGKYKEMGDALFSKTVDTTDDAVIALAKDLGLDVGKFTSDLHSDKVKNRITKDNSDAEALSLGGTPSIFMNNQSVDNFNNLESLVSAQLGK